MHRRSVVLVICAMVLAAGLAGAGIDREKHKIRHIELPWVDISGEKFSGLRAEVAYGATTVSPPVLRTTKTWCKPRGSKNPLKDAVEVPTHYYEISHKTPEGFLVLRDDEDHVMYTVRLDSLESSDRFGYEECAYFSKSNLENDWAKRGGAFQSTIGAHVREVFTNWATSELDDALFARVLDEKVPLYTFKDKRHDYSDLARAAEAAREGYPAFKKNVVDPDDPARASLKEAVDLWRQALAEADLVHKEARIHRKVAVRLHANIGVALMLLGENREAIKHFEDSLQISTMSASRSDGTGIPDLLDRTKDRDRRARRNERSLLADDVDARIATAKQFRGRVPVAVLAPTEMARLAEIHAGHSVAEVVAEYAHESEQREKEVASGERNPYAHMVANTTSQGFILFLMPYPNKMESFPAEVCDLTHLNRLRMPNHKFDSVPEEIGNLTGLEVLDLSGNSLSSLPDSIADLIELRKLSLKNNNLQALPDGIEKLKNLRTLELKGNPMAAGEIERIKTALPKCKVKA